MSINPVRLSGVWDEGYVLDNHVISSEYLGEDAFGHPRYNTLRSELGEALYQYKYRYKRERLDDIMMLAIPFLDGWTALKAVDVVIPVPPSQRERLYQPVFELAREIADYLGVSYVDDVLVKTSDEQSKHMEANGKSGLAGTIIARRKAAREYNILIVDDLYQSGATLNECVKALRNDEKLKKVYVLAITRTRGENESLCRRP